ncbi:MAG: PhzF family phenazine biosynthesis protein [Clostridia bacterium]|jgi:PhzF family phenazine biosynthesis protein|nr:PhzF family phenazine biosynthesis protein [Clostridia bacterium]MBT7121878.1 PhzF family phenazine biosynthesis protein [Clostridia bacterium]
MKIYIVDAFTSEPYAGNPAAICLLGSEKPDEWMQKIAAEMNLSETAFLIKQDDGFALRWFTPTAEVDLCGHATLASAHWLWESQTTDVQEIRFHTKSGLLTARKNGDWIEMNFPLEREEKTPPPPSLEEILGVPFKYVGKNRMDYLVEVENQETLAQLETDFALLKTVSTRGLIVTALSDEPDVDFVSRCFFPGLGIDEDPVTGSAHCCLGPYWSSKLGKDELTAKQVSARGGLLKLQLLGERILISGRAVTTLSGELSAEE